MIAPIETVEARPLARETKFLISPEIAGQIRAWARENLQPDPQAVEAVDDTYTITSLYLDTPALDIFSRSKKAGRSKYRIRRYGESEGVFLERKLRTSALLGKHRAWIPLSQLTLLSGGAAPPEGWPGVWFQRRMAARRFQPVCQISYERMARVGTSLHGPIRLTLDENLRAASVPGLAFVDEAGVPVLPGLNSVVLEMKYRATLPAKFKELLTRFHLSPVSFSKYRAAVPRLDGTADNRSLLSCLRN